MEIFGNGNLYIPAVPIHHDKEESQIILLLQVN